MVDEGTEGRRPKLSGLETGASIIPSRYLYAAWQNRPIAGPALGSFKHFPFPYARDVLWP